MLPKNRRPTPPGEIIKYEYMEPLGLTQQQLAAVSLLSVVPLKIGKNNCNRTYAKFF